MTPELLNLLSPEERAAWALCEGATPGPYTADLDVFDHNTCEIEACVSNNPCTMLFTAQTDVNNDGNDEERARKWEIAKDGQAFRDALFLADARTSLPAALTTIATLRHHLAEQQRAFVIGLDLAQRTADAEIAELRATLDNERGEGAGPSEKWTWLDGAWRILDDFGGCAMSVHPFDNGRWHWRQHDPPYGRSKFPFTSARSAMKAADAAVKGST